MIFFVIAWVLLLVVLNAGRHETKPLTLSQIDQLHGQLITEAFENNISIEWVDADSDEPEEAGDEDQFIDNPAFDTWCAEQGAHLRATCSAEEVDAFIRTGKFPKGFKHTRKSPSVFLVEYNA